MATRPSHAYATSPILYRDMDPSWDSSKEEDFRCHHNELFLSTISVTPDSLTRTYQCRCCGEKIIEKDFAQA